MDSIIYKFINGRGKIPTWEFFEIVRHLEKNIIELCGPVCSKNNLCLLHKKLNCLNLFSEYIRDRNINRNDIVSKISMCINNWCFEIYETKYLKDCSLSMSWRS